MNFLPRRRRGGVEPTQRQHGDVFERRGRADEASQRFGYVAHDLAAAATCMRAKHGLEPVLAEQVATRIVRFRHAIAVEVKRFPGGEETSLPVVYTARGWMPRIMPLASSIARGVPPLTRYGGLWPALQ